MLRRVSGAKKERPATRRADKRHVRKFVSGIQSTIDLQRELNDVVFTAQRKQERISLFMDANVVAQARGKRARRLGSSGQTGEDCTHAA